MRKDNSKELAIYIARAVAKTIHSMAYDLDEKNLDKAEIIITAIASFIPNFNSMMEVIEEEGKNNEKV